MTSTNWWCHSKPWPALIDDVTISHDQHKLMMSQQTMIGTNWWCHNKFCAKNVIDLSMASSCATQIQIFFFILFYEKVIYVILWFIHYFTMGNIVVKFIPLSTVHLAKIWHIRSKILTKKLMVFVRGMM